MKLTNPGKQYLYAHINPQYQYISLQEWEHKILTACYAFDHSSTTNSEIKIEAKVDMPAAAVGKIMARLRAAKLINYQHIETGRMAAGSGRYVLLVQNDYFGMVLPGECEHLPPL